MAIEQLMELVSVKGMGQTSEGMLTTGETLKASVESAGPLPGYPRIWRVYFKAHDDLELAATLRKMRLKLEPEVKEAADSVRVGLRVLGDTVHNSVVSLVPEETEAGQRILPMVPENYKLVVDDRENWMGKVQLMTNVLHQSHRTDVKTIGAWKKLLALEGALAHYQRVFGELPYKIPLADDENLSKHLQNCRRALRMVILQLLVIAYEKPELVEQIERMLQPYLNLVQRKQNRSRGKKKNNQAASDDGETASETKDEADETDGSTAEAPANETAA